MTDTESAAPLRVLIAESDRVNADTLADLARTAGHDVRVEHYDTGAMDRAAEFKPHVVLLDLAMPGMNGTRVPAEIEARAGMSALVVALTEPADLNGREQAELAGFDRILIRPDVAGSLRQLFADAVTLITPAVR